MANNKIEYGIPLKYKDICEMLEDEFKPSGKSRNLQLKRWNKQYLVTKDKTWYKIERKRTEAELELKQIENYTRPHKLFDKYNKSSNIIDYNFVRNHGGVYKFQYNNIIYIGQTNNLYKRFTEHVTFNKETEAGKLLLKGGFYEVLKVEEDSQQRLALEEKYIKKYSNNSDYICINDDYNQNRNNVKSKRKKARYKHLTVNYNDWEQVREFLEKENIKYK